jgi:hypothetical protein
MNNLFALNQYIGSVTQAVNSLAKSNTDLLARVTKLETTPSSTTASSSSDDTDKKIEELTKKLEALEASQAKKLEALEASQAKKLEALEKSQAQKIADAVSKAKVEILTSIEDVVSKLDVDKKIEEAITQLKSELNIECPDIDIVNAISVEAAEAAEAAPAYDEVQPLGDDIILGVKDESSKKAPAKRKSPKRI